jgi:hypothetical protein
MATTNLISKSLGDLLTESGNGAPDHTSPMGSLYTDKDTGNVWRNTDGETTWEKLQTVAYGEGYVQGNSTNTTIVSLNTWAASGINLTEGIVNGFSGGTEHLTLLDGYDGDYEIKCDATLTHVAGTPNFEVGISLNDIPPTGSTSNGNNGEIYSGCYLDSTQSSQHIGVQTIFSLIGGDTLSIDIRNITDSSNVLLEHAQLFVRKVG